jgi:hypothetical protein
MLFVLLGVFPKEADTYPIPTLLVIAAAFAIGYRITTHYRQAFLAWVLSCAVIPGAYLLCCTSLKRGADGVSSHTFSELAG